MEEIKTAQQLDAVADKQANENLTEKEITGENKGFRSNNRTGGFNGKRRTAGAIPGFDEKIIQIKKINKTTKGGRRMRFSALVIVGNKKGQVGYGIGKSIEVPVAIKKALKNANKNIVRVAINKNGTAYHDAVGKVCASKVLIKPAKVGTGLIAGGSIRAVVELAGFKDIYTKSQGASTALNMIQATINALKSQMTPAQVAQNRGKGVKDI